MRKMRKWSLAKLQAEIREEDTIRRAKQSRPLQPGDKQNRETFCLSGKAFWRSLVFRKDGSVEIWIRRYRDRIYDYRNHKNWKLICELRPVTPEE